MTRSVVSSDRVPEALGPGRPAIATGGFLFCSRMAGIEPTTGLISPARSALPEGAGKQGPCRHAEMRIVHNDRVDTTDAQRIIDMPDCAHD